MSSIKFAPTSTFTEEEISRMRSFKSGNEAINKAFLAAYDAKNRNHPRHITSESDVRERKSFLKQKYVKRTWYRDHYGNSLELSNSNRARNDQRIMEDRQDKIIRQYDPHYIRPHETILKVMTLPQNKRCADCSTKVRILFIKLICSITYVYVLTYPVYLCVSLNLATHVCRFNSPIICM